MNSERDINTVDSLYLPEHTKVLLEKYMKIHDKNFDLGNFTLAAIFEKLKNEIGFQKQPFQYAYIPKLFLEGYKIGEEYIKDMPMPLHTRLKYITYSELQYPFEIYKVQLIDPTDYQLLEEIMVDQSTVKEVDYYSCGNDWEIYSAFNPYTRNCIYTNKFRIIELVKDINIFGEFFDKEDDAKTFLKVINVIFKNCKKMSQVIAKTDETKLLTVDNFNYIDYCLYHFIKNNKSLEERFAYNIKRYEESRGDNEVVKCKKTHLIDDARDTFFATFNGCSNRSLLHNFDKEINNIFFGYFCKAIAQSLRWCEDNEDNNIIHSYIIAALMQEENVTEKYSFLLNIVQLGYYADGIDDEKNLINIMPLFDTREKQQI